jgi:hypothetical protein
MSVFVYRNYCICEAWENAPQDICQQVGDYKELLEMSLEDLTGIKSDDEKNHKQSASMQSNEIMH